MAKDEKKVGYQAVSVPETVRPAIVNEAGQEVSMTELLVEIRNDVKELKRKLVGE